MKPDDIVTNEINQTARQAYEASGSRRYQGFYYMPRHYIRDLSLAHGPSQVVWQDYGAGDDYDRAHNAMIAELGRLQMAAALASVIPLFGERLAKIADDMGAEWELKHAHSHANNQMARAAENIADAIRAATKG